jgi:hypothetical protein
VQALLKQYPSYRIDVYPTRRSVGFPEWVLEGTKNAATKATVSNEGLTLKGAQGGLPFPVPKSGYEAMWNHLTTYVANFRLEGESWYVDANGRPVLGDKPIFQQNNSGQWDPRFKGQEEYYYNQGKFISVGPPRRTGNGLLCYNPVDFAKWDRPVWLYYPAQRRVRLASDITYDVPNSALAGITNMDDANMFNGPMDRFDFKLIGKKELYVPYNCYKAAYFTDEHELLGPQHLNPDHLRWELHRMWVVEGRLKEGKKHNYSLRRYYLDEDSWLILAADLYDLKGRLFRVGLAYLTFSYDVKAPTHHFYGFYDLNSRMYSVQTWPSKRGRMTYIETPDPREFSPEALAGEGVR